jgi:hypothetical protein
MNRRNFMTAAAAAGMAAAPLSAAGENRIFELRWFRMRNGPQVQRTTEFLGGVLAPAAKRAGSGPLGFFSATIGEQSPFILMLASYGSLQGVGDAIDRLMADKEFRKGFDQYNAAPEPGFVRMENELLRAFDTQVSLAAPPPQKTARIFEMRTYESSGWQAGKTKVKMFNEGEANIFRRLGMAPVFFGETLVGRNLPNLTYMLSFNDLADRDAKWKAFRTDPDWERMRSIPEYADALIVSNISNTILQPLSFSDIR